LNGIKFAISSNVQAAFQKLRSQTATVYLWVDAICINQSDDEEKSVQVATMLKIFQKAEKVHAWLGPQSQDSDLAMVCLSELYFTIKDQLEYNANKKHSEACVDRLQAIHTAVCNLFARPWFRRTWIRQEIYAANTIEVHCGSKSMAWDSFWRGNVFWTELSQLPP
jgi:hypothetical protein